MIRKVPGDCYGGVHVDQDVTIFHGFHGFQTNQGLPAPESITTGDPTLTVVEELSVVVEEAAHGVVVSVPYPNSVDPTSAQGGGAEDLGRCLEIPCGEGG